MTCSLGIVFSRVHLYFWWITKLNKTISFGIGIEKYDDGSSLSIFFYEENFFFMRKFEIRLIQGCFTSFEKTLSQRILASELNTVGDSEAKITENESSRTVGLNYMFIFNSAPHAGDGLRKREVPRNRDCQRNGRLVIFCLFSKAVASHVPRRSVEKEWASPLWVWAESEGLTARYKSSQCDEVHRLQKREVGSLSASKPPNPNPRVICVPTKFLTPIKVDFVYRERLK